ncbi:short chain dehydrogenase domain-containing protein [Trichoderma breve]|uniref:Short chain dehydrogenase domain-containing protein n=1 Tax=Trichoderma breve TaxID=2034170 RepID=A0A9W9BBQ7_9HYPO|nr:short chain dehydrogenase domain-containing protein [Trichoderma breve]KAJ4859529.1 short chain dehydrogenase domain-containing protein [Trichoderma breve]
MKPVVLILGAGANIGASVAKKFAANGYLVAISARGLRNGSSPEGYLLIQADLADKFAVPRIFETVKSAIGTPNVVIYNAASVTPSSHPDDIFSISPDALERDIWTNSFSALSAARCAVVGFHNLPQTFKKTFIYTGNWLNTTISSSSSMLTLGIGKAASAYWIGAADQHYSPRGYRFFYADQRTSEGSAMRYGPDSEAHATFFYELAPRGDEALPWHCTFVKGRGYVDFN